MRKDFPIFKNNKNLVYLDNAATTQKPQVVIDTITKFYKKENANAHRGLYPLSVIVTEKLDLARENIANFINAKKEEIIFTKSATEGFNQLAIALGETLGSWESVIITELEHHSNFVPWQQLCKKTSSKLIVAKYNKETFELEDVSELVDSRTGIVSITAMSNVTGQILDIEKLIKKIKEKNSKVKVIVDATQLIAHKKIDVKKIGADFIVFSAHKMYAPAGVGVVWGNCDTLIHIRPFLYGGNMIAQVNETESTWAEIPYKFEAGTIDAAGIIALSTAINYLDKLDTKKIELIEHELKEYALQELRKIDHIKIIGHNKKNYGPLISFHLIDIHPHDLAEICGQENICIRAGHHCAQPLMKALDIVATSRISLSFYNTKKEIDVLVKAINKARKIING